MQVRLNKQPFKGKWGIFFIKKGIDYLNHILSLDIINHDPKLHNIGYSFLESHEMFHAKFDVSTLGLETIAKKHLYLPQKNAFRRCRSQEPEEALANLSAINKIKQEIRKGLPSEYEIFFYSFMKRQTGAYSRFDENENDLKTEIASGFFNHHWIRNAQSSNLGPWIGVNPPYVFDRRDVPKYLIQGIKFSKRFSPSRFIPKVNVITENYRFKKMLYPGHEKFWDSTKYKLIKNSFINGLDFKYYPPDSPNWSVKVNDNFRAHLSPISFESGEWEAVKYGDHKSMGHG